MTFLYLCIMNRITPTYTKKELSLMYFPNDSHVNGWRKLKTILADETRLHALLRSRRHTIYPHELALILQEIGDPRSTDLSPEHLR